MATEIQKSFMMPWMHDGSWPTTVIDGRFIMVDDRYGGAMLTQVDPRYSDLLSMWADYKNGFKCVTHQFKKQDIFQSFKFGRTTMKTTLLYPSATRH